MLAQEGQSGAFSVRAWHVLALEGALVLSLVLNISLGWKVKRLEYVVDRLPAAPSLPAGTRMPRAFPASTPAGGRTQVMLARGRRTVLYVFTPTCRWCSANQRNLKALLEYRAGEYRFIGISLTDFELNRYMESAPSGLPVYTSPDAGIAKLLHFGNTPQMIVVSPSGEIIASWVGAWVGPTQSQVEQFFHVQLPGLSQ